MNHSPANTATPGGNKTLWAATLVVIVVVLAMGAALIRIQSRPIEPRLAVLPKPGQNQATPTTPKIPSTTMSSTPANKASSAMDNVAVPTIEITARPQPVLPRNPEPAVLRPPAMGGSATANPESQQILPR